MQITAYTDGSTNNNLSCIAFIVLNQVDEIYIGSGIKSYNVSKNVWAECFAVRDCCRYIVRNIQNTEDIDVTIFSDLKGVSNTWNLIKSNSSVLNKLHTAYRDILNYSYCMKNLDIKYVKSHSKVYTPNKVCDIWAKRFRGFPAMFI